MWWQILAVFVVAAVFVVRLVLALNDRPSADRDSASPRPEHSSVPADSVTTSADEPGGGAQPPSYSGAPW